MALPKLDNVLEFKSANDNQRSKVMEGFSATSSVVANALSTEVLPDAADDRVGLKLVSESLSKLHDTVYKTLALLIGRTKLEEYIADDQLRVQGENLREGDTARLLNQEAGLGGSLLGSADEQTMLLAALGSMSEALEKIIDTVNNIEPGDPGSDGGDMPPVDIDVDRRRSLPTQRRDTRFVAKSKAVDRKGRVRPGYTAVNTGKSGTRYMRSATSMSKPSVLGRLTAKGGRVTSSVTGLGATAALAGLSSLASGGFSGGPGGGSFGARGIMGGALGAAMGGGFGLGGMAAGAAAVAGMGIISTMSAPRPRPMVPQTGPFTVGLGGFAIPTTGTVTSNYGLRSSFATSTGRSSSDHKGVDIGAPHGTPVIASKDGIVTFAGMRGSYGNLVIIDHGGGLETRYAHLSAITVGTNAPVRQGQVIGNVGQTGSSTGPHLHFEIRSGGQAIDPATYIGSNPPSQAKVAALTPPPRAPINVTIPGPAAPAPAQLASLSVPGRPGAPSPLNPQRDYVNHWAAA